MEDGKVKELQVSYSVARGVGFPNVFWRISEEASQLCRRLSTHFGKFTAAGFV